MSSVSGPSTPEPRRPSSTFSVGKLSLSSDRSCSVSPPGSPMSVSSGSTQNSVISLASRFFLGLMSPGSSPLGRPERAFSVVSAAGGGGRGAGASSPIESVALSALSMSRSPSPGELLGEKRFSGTNGVFEYTDFGPFATTQASYDEKITNIFRAPGDKIKFNLEDLDAVTGTAVSDRGSPSSPSLKTIDKLTRQLYLDITREGSITLFGHAFTKANFSNPEDADTCKAEIKSFITDQLTAAGLSPSVSLRVVNSLHQGIQAPVIGLVNLIFNQSPSIKESAHGAAAAAESPESGSLDREVLDALSGMPTSPLGDIKWEKMKVAPYNTLDISVSKSGSNVKIESSLFFRPTGSVALRDNVYQAKISIEDLASGLSYIEITRVV